MKANYEIRKYADGLLNAVASRYRCSKSLLSWLGSEAELGWAGHVEDDEL